MEENNKVEEVANNIEGKISETLSDAKDGIVEVVNGIKNEIDDYTAEQDQQDIKNNKAMAILAYIGPLFLIPLFAAKDSKFARFHTNQGLVLFIICMAIRIFVWTCGIIAKKLAAILLIPSFLLYSLVGVMMVFGIIYAAQGKAKELPVVGNWKILK